jgi:hypothetical protein
LTSRPERVEWWVDGTLRHVNATRDPHWLASKYWNVTWTWNVTEEEYGEHVLEARAYDFAGNENAAIRNVTIVPPTAEGLQGAATSEAGGLRIAPETSLRDAFTASLAAARAEEPGAADGPFVVR